MKLPPQILYFSKDGVLAHRALLAFCAISRLLSALIDPAREGPPIRPPFRDETFLAFIAGGVVLSEIAACTTRNALTFKSTKLSYRY